jgi:hypothetical protein
MARLPETAPPGHLARYERQVAAYDPPHFEEPEPEPDPGPDAVVRAAGVCAYYPLEPNGD